MDHLTSSEQRNIVQLRTSDDGGEDEDGVDGVGDDGGHHNVKSKAKLW